MPMAAAEAAFASLALFAALLAAGSVATARGVPSGLPELPLADCGIEAGDTSRWQASGLLDDAARRWTLGADLRDALAQSGYTATAVSGLHFFGLDAPNTAHLDSSSCRVLRDPSFKEVGVYRRGDELWMVFAARAVLPDPADAAATVRRALTLVNEAREQGQHCGNRTWPRANPVRSSAVLSEVARQHALDMARHHYFDHQDPAGRLPAERIRAAGYREQRVAENIAYGTLSIDEAIAGWLKSPGHCENVMEPRFREMGIGFAPNSADPRQLYWVQLLADPG